MKRLFTSLKVFFYVLGLCVIVAGVFVVIRFVKAGPQWVTVYPTSCLGGWENPSLAQGVPQLGPDAAPQDFTIENSARLEHKNSQIFCGGFSFQSIENTSVQGLVLKFSWAIRGSDNAPKIKPEKQGHSKDQSASVVTSVPENHESEIKPDTKDHPVSDSENNPVEIQDNSQNDSKVVPSGEIDTSSGTGASDTGGGPDSSAAPTSDSSGSAQSSGDTSFNFKSLFDTAYAEEVAVPTTTDATSTEPETVQPEALFEVKYSVDGNVWTSLGTVTRVSLPSAVFTIPTEHLSSWASLANLQIRVDRLTTLDDPVVYLDGMSLTATYVPSTPNSSLEVVAIPETLHISGLATTTGALPLHIERVDGKETLIISSDNNGPIGGLVIFDNASGAIVLDTHVDAPTYNIPAESVGIGSFMAISTPDPDHCHTKARIDCAAEAGATSNLFTIQLYQTPQGSI